MSFKRDDYSKAVNDAFRLQIKDLRVKANKTQHEVAKYIGLSCSQYRNLENGRTQFGLATAMRLFSLYGCKEIVIG